MVQARLEFLPDGHSRGIGSFRVAWRACHLLANRFNGTNQLDFRVFDPQILDTSTFSLNGVSGVPTIEALEAFAAPQITRRIAGDFQAPTFVMTAVNVERQLPSKFTFFAVFFNYRGKHLLRLRNLNAPLPGTYDPENPNNAVRPLGNVGDLYYYESSATFNDYRFFGGVRRQMSKGFSLFANFGTGRGKTDTDCIFGSIGVFRRTLRFWAVSIRAWRSFGANSYWRHAGVAK